RAARANLGSVGLLVDAPLAARLPLEVLDGIGHVDLPSIDARLGERGVEKAARRPDERPAGNVLGVAGLLADHHDARRSMAFAEDRLRSPLPERAALARRGLPPDRLQLVDRLHGALDPCQLRTEQEPSGAIVGWCSALRFDWSRSSSPTWRGSGKTPCASSRGGPPRSGSPCASRCPRGRRAAASSAAACRRWLVSSRPATSSPPTGTSRAWSSTSTWSAAWPRRSRCARSSVACATPESAWPCTCR